MLNPSFLPWSILAVDVEEMVGSGGALAPGAGDVEAGVGENDDGDDDDGDDDDGDDDDDDVGICVLVVVLVIVTDIHTVLVEADSECPRA